MATEGKYSTDTVSSILLDNVCCVGWHPVTKINTF